MNYFHGSDQQQQHYHSPLRLSKSSSFQHEGNNMLKERGFTPGMLSAKDLTGAPLISLAPSSNRRLRRTKTYQPVTGPLDQSASNYYHGQNLYQKKNVRSEQDIYIQDFYKNPSFDHHMNKSKYAIQHTSSNDFFNGTRYCKTSSFAKSSENLSDTQSVSSDDLDNFKPRIIKPRRRKKKEKRRPCDSSVSYGGEEDGQCLGSEKQWLPTGLLSAESESCGDSGRSDSASSDERDHLQSPSAPGRRGHRKLGATLSMPTYALSDNYGSGCSDYFSQVSPGSRSSRGSVESEEYGQHASHVGSDLCCESDHSTDLCNDMLPIGSSAYSSSHSMLAATKSYNHTDSFYSQTESPLHPPRSPERARLRKTNSWAYPVGGSARSMAGEFSLFSPGQDLLSGIRKHLSKIDINEDESLNTSIQ